MPAQLRVEIVPEVVHEAEIAEATAALLDHELVQVDYAGHDLWMVAHDVVDKGPEAGQRFSAIIQDMDSGQVLLASGRFDDLEYSALFHAEWQRPPTDDEFAWAVRSLREDAELGPALVSGETEVYRPMPPHANIIDADGHADRVVAVGLRTASGQHDVIQHRVVGVRILDGEIIRLPVGVPEPSGADCGAPRQAPAAVSAVLGARQARVRVFDGETQLWELVVVRPSASSGTSGSGVELRTVDYRGGRVLHRAHLPILNVDYGPDGPSQRHWAHQEHGFEAAGDEPVAGFRLCPSPAQTVLETGVDGGDFRGVALWVEDDTLVLASQLEAGPYRYISEWRLSADGTIRPRLGFSAAANPTTCQPHVHHAYWRLDFDILAPGSNVLREHNDPPIRGETKWHSMRFEVRRPRDADHNRFWRIRHDRDGRDYSIMPGPADGTADAFGAGDVWILHYDPDELDDGQGFTTDPHMARAQLDRYVTGEPLQSRDLVVWYAVHVAHGGDGPVGSDRVGPDLVAGHWTTKSLPDQELLGEPGTGR